VKEAKINVKNIVYLSLFTIKLGYQLSVISLLLTDNMVMPQRDKRLTKFFESIDHRPWPRVLHSPRR